MTERSAGCLALSLLAVRLLTWAFLLPPWAGFDEPYHQGYAEVESERLRWPTYREIPLPGRLIDAMRHWPLPPSYARIFSSRQYGEKIGPTIVPFQDTNYETQQSPLYYWAAGLLLRCIPSSSPVVELYVLRTVNAAMAFAIGWLLLRSGTILGLGWRPVAVLALMPGFGAAMCRVSNDALCALLISVAVAGSLSANSSAWNQGSLAAGLAPWAKLYGLAAIPGNAIREASRREVSVSTRWFRVFLITVPPLVLAFLSWRRMGNAVPIMYNIEGAGNARLLEIPWLRDAWAVVKTHIWVSGMSFLVFPTWVYLIPAGLVGWALALTFSVRSVWKLSEIRVLLAPIVMFGLALGYHNWRTFSFYGGPGGTGGWYLWAVALPEVLLITYGAVQSRSYWLRLFSGVFLVLTVLGDAILFFDSTGLLVRSSAGHVLGIRSGSLPYIMEAYSDSRPMFAGVAGVSFAILSWFLAGIVVWKLSTSDQANRTSASSRPFGPRRHV